MVLMVFSIGFVAVSHTYAAGTAAEAEELVKKAVIFVKANGVAKAIETLNKKDSVCQGRLVCLYVSRQ